MKNKKYDLIISFALLFILLGALFLKIYFKIYDKNNNLLNLINSAISEIDSYPNYEKVEDYYNDASYRFILNDIYENSLNLTEYKRSDYAYAIQTTQIDLSILSFKDVNDELTEEDITLFKNAYGELKQMANGHNAALVFSIIFFALGFVCCIIRIIFYCINKNKKSEKINPIEVEAEEIQ